MLSLGTGRYETAGKNNTTYTSLKAKLTNVISSATDTEGKFSDYTPYDVWGKKSKYMLLLFAGFCFHLSCAVFLWVRVIPSF